MKLLPSAAQSESTFCLSPTPEFVLRKLVVTVSDVETGGMVPERIETVLWYPIARQSPVPARSAESATQPLLLSYLPSVQYAPSLTSGPFAATYR